jgi:glycosyltransferase involved in cell wall biosynthesis
LIAATLRYLLIATHVPRSGAGGGMVRYAVELADALSRRDDIELHLLATSEGAEFFAHHIPQAHTHRAPGLPTPARSLLERAGTVPALRDAGFDVVHGTKHLLPWRSRAQVTLLTAHDMLPLDRPGDFPLAKRVLLRRPYLRSAHEADVIACVSNATRTRLLHYVPSVAEKAGVVPLAVSSTLATVSPRPIPRLAGRRFAMVVGDASLRKNLRLAVDTWPEVRAAVPDAVLAVVGPRDWGRTHRGHGWDDQVADGHIAALGQVSDGELRWCYENAAVVLCPSILEGFGLPVVEAARFGAPVVSSTDPALCEAAGHQATAVPVTDRAAWVRAVVTRLSGERDPVPSTSRSWDDVGEETVRMVRTRLAEAPISR